MSVYHISCFFSPTNTLRVVISDQTAKVKMPRFCPGDSSQSRSQQSKEQSPHGFLRARAETAVYRNEEELWTTWQRERPAGRKEPLPLSPAPSPIQVDCWKERASNRDNMEHADMKSFGGGDLEETHGGGSLRRLLGVRHEEVTRLRNGQTEVIKPSVFCNLTRGRLCRWR